MMTTDTRTGVRLCILLSSAALLWACGGKVVFIEEGGEGGNGTGDSVVSSAEVAQSSSSSSSSSTGGGVLCAGEEETCTGLGTNVCKCIRDCGFSQLQANCAPDEKGVVVCVCSYDQVFSGTCFEKTSAVCNIDIGCCAKYFQGI